MVVFAGNANQDLVMGDSDIPYPYRIGNLYAAKAFTSADGTTATTLATGAPGYYITAFGYQIDATTTIASAGMISIMFTDTASGGWGTFRAFVPAAFAAGNTPGSVRQVNDGPFVWSNKVANSSVQVALDTALTAGSVRCFIRYGRTAQLG